LGGSARYKLRTTEKKWDLGGEEKELGLDATDDFNHHQGTDSNSPERAFGEAPVIYDKGKEKQGIRMTRLEKLFRDANLLGARKGNGKKDRCGASRVKFPWCWRLRKKTLIKLSA